MHDGAEGGDDGLRPREPVARPCVPPARGARAAVLVVRVRIEEHVEVAACVAPHVRVFRTQRAVPADGRPDVTVLAVHARRPRDSRVAEQ
jgi:hypothetical protein